MTGDGLVLLKHAPLPHARPSNGSQHRPADAPEIVARYRTVCLHGHGAKNSGPGYPWSIMAYRGGAVGRVRAAHAIQRACRPYVAGRDGRFLTNTWGDRNRDGRICDQFRRGEITAAARIGADAVQIDDGWQRGISANSVHRDQGGVW